jgi:hypothetical protein
LEADPDERLQWTIRAAGERAKAGDNGLPDQVTSPAAKSLPPP